MSRQSDDAEVRLSGTVVRIELTELVEDQAADVSCFERIGGCFDQETILADGGG